jgi:iron(III) transport system substrate-binding protein
MSSKAQLFRRPFAKGLRLAALLAAAAVVLAGPARPLHAAELNVYSHRQPVLINPVLKAFEKETGVKVNVVFSATGLVQRLLAEGARSPADVVLTVDIGRLYAYADKGLLAPVSSDLLTANIPARLRDRENRWFAFSKRARVLATARQRVGPDEIRRMEDLADPKWKGRICTRPGSHVYNRALMASMIAAHGEEAAEEWARGLVANLARRPQGNDRSQVKAIHEGVCDVAIINSYYYGKLKTSDVPEQRAWADSVRIVFTNQQGRGNHMNISGGGVARHSRNKALAVSLLEFLTKETAQKLYGEVNAEYPVNPRVAPSAEVRSWGSFLEDELPIGRIAELAPAAQRIIDRVGW